MLLLGFVEEYAAECLINTINLLLTCRKKPTYANVNCWFCNQNTVVPYGNRNCWDCPNCDQYNGFQEVILYFGFNNNIDVYWYLKFI